jgi:predicted dehydrogenase
MKATRVEDRMEVRWGFVGAGSVTQAKASPTGAFTQERSRVVAVARADADRAEAYARANGIDRAYATVEALCADPEVDAVFVCTPHHLHTDHVLAAIRAGKHVLCEKPLTITTEDGANVVQAAQQAGVVLAVAYYRRFYPVLETLKGVVESGRLGTLTTAQLVCRSHSIPKRPVDGTLTPGWRTRVETAGGGTLTDVGSHRLDLLFWLLGDAVSVSATVDRFETWADGEDQATVSVQFANRVSGHLNQSWCSRVSCDSIALYGTHGAAFVEDIEGTRLTVQIGRDVEMVETTPRSQATHRPLVTDFVRALTEGGSVRCSGADALRTTQLIELAYQAARERRTLEVPGLRLAQP